MNTEGKGLINPENLANWALDEDLGNLVWKSHLFTKLNLREEGTILLAFHHKNCQLIYPYKKLCFLNL